MEQFLADPGPPTRGRRALAACIGGRVPTWHVGIEAGCAASTRGYWKRAGQPDPAAWEAPDLTPENLAQAECRLPFCDLWVESRTKLFCEGHYDALASARSARSSNGSSPIASWSAPPASTLRALAPQLRLEFQYALQCRYDSHDHRVAPPAGHTRRPARVNAGIASLLDLSEQQWREAAAARPNQSADRFLLHARDAIEALRDGTGWEVEYPRDIWRLDRLPGIAEPGKSPVSSRPVAVRPHRPALAAGSGQTLGQAAADVRAEHRRGPGRTSMP